MLIENIVPKKIIQSEGCLNERVLLEKNADIMLFSEEKYCEISPSGYLILDFGKEYQGGIKLFALKMGDKRQAKVRIRFGESVMETCSDIGYKNSTNDHSIRDDVVSVPWGGSLEYGMSGFRFCRIDNVDNVPICFTQIVGLYKHSGKEILGKFECNDEQINSVWDASVRTIYLNNNEYVTDGIKRDRVVWIGDMYPEVSSILKVFGQDESLLRSLDFMMENTQLPEWMNDIPSYSLWWIIILRKIYEYGAEYKRPNEDFKAAFEEREKTLRACVPDEMKARANWVAIKTWWNEEKGRYAKRPIDCNTGEYAESDNSDTWTSFDKALEYAREHGGTTIAYALDGKDRIVCVDLDHCYDENGELSKTAKEVLQKSGITYAERSVSGNGLHVFGKASAMDLRTFSKDGDLEFYQKDQFIAMTGDGAKTKDLMNFDTCEMKPFLEKKCEKRAQFIGTGKGVSGLSTMSDKDVVEKASAAKNGEKFKALYSGENLQNNHSNSDMSLMNLLAYWCNGDKEQILRVFATSGLYRPNKSVDYYEHTAIKAIRDIPQKTTYTPTLPKNTGGNGKR